MVRDITQQSEYVIALTHVTRVLLGGFELMLSIGNDSVVIGSFVELQSLNCCVKSVDSGINKNCVEIVYSTPAGSWILLKWHYGQKNNSFFSLDFKTMLTKH